MVFKTRRPPPRYAFAAAEEERTGGVAPRASPAARIADCGSLLQRAGFSLITVDVEKIVVDYGDAFLLMDDLSNMGEAHAPLAPQFASRDAFLAAAAAYHDLFPARAPGGPVRATFEVVFLIGWAPHASQRAPDARGSATAKIGDLPPATWAPDGDGFVER